MQGSARYAEGFPAVAVGYEGAVPPVVAFVSVPLTVALLSAILVLSAIAERRLLSPRALVLSVVGTSKSAPEFAEAFVAQQLKALADQRRA